MRNDAAFAGHAACVSGWSHYLEQFHRENAGVTEEVFTRLERDGGAVEDWILGSDVGDGRVLEVGCGSAALADRLRGRWVGIDRSAAELALARRRGAGPLVRADAIASADRAGDARRRRVPDELDAPPAAR